MELKDLKKKHIEYFRNGMVSALETLADRAGYSKRESIEKFLANNEYKGILRLKEDGQNYVALITHGKRHLMVKGSASSIDELRKVLLNTKNVSRLRKLSLTQMVYIPFQTHQTKYNEAAVKELFREAYGKSN